MTITAQNHLPWPAAKTAFRAGRLKPAKCAKLLLREETFFPRRSGFQERTRYGYNSREHLPMEGFQVNRPPTTFDPEHDLPPGISGVSGRPAPPLRAAAADADRERKQILAESHQGEKPTHRFPGDAVRRGWRIELPEWCQDQRNQMTGPADDADLVVKMLNSGAPGVMLDLEDSMVNEWEHQRIGVENILQALRGTLTYFDKKRDKLVGIEPKADGDLDPAARIAHSAGRNLRRGADVRVAVRCCEHRVPGGSGRTEASAVLSTFPSPSRRKKRCGGAMCFRRWLRRADGRATTSSAWRWWSRIRWRFRWRSFSTTCATTLWD